MTIGSISPVSGYSAYGGISGIYPSYQSVAVSPARGVDAVRRGSDGTAQGVVDGAKDAASSGRVDGECQTCENRTYVDGSDEHNVSFKAPAHIDPENSASAVMSHELEHVSNARAEGSEPGKELVSVSVALKTSICPECGRVYVSGGVTNTTMRETKNPYARNQANLDYAMASGANFDIGA